MATRWLVLAAVLLPCAHAAAQQRKPCFVTVVDADDRPLASAEVTLVDDGFAGAPMDVVRATTDERGRCRPALAVGRLYTTWAIGPAGADGSRLVTEPTDRGACSAIVELCALHRWTPRRVRIVEPDATRGSWSRGLHLLGPDGTSAAVLAVDAHGTAPLPPAPWSPLAVGIRDASGALLGATTITPDDPSPELHVAAHAIGHVRLLAPDGTPAKDARAALSSPVSRVFRDAASRAWAPPCFGPRARADAHGNFALPLLAVGRATPVRWIELTAAGCAPVHVVDRELTASSAERPLLVTAEPPRPRRARLRGSTANETVVPRVTAHIVRAAEERAAFATAVSLPATADGGELRFELPAAARVAHAVFERTPVEAAASPRLAALALEPGAQPELPAIDLAALRKFRLRVADAEGAPAGGAEIALWIGDGSAGEDWIPCAHLVADANGRAELQLGVGHWALYVGTRSEHGFAWIGAERAAGPIEVPLRAFPAMRCRVVGDDGQPVRGARLERIGRSGFSGTRGGPEGWAHEHLAAKVAWPVVLQARSDRTGTLVVPIQDWRPWDATVRICAGERESEPIELKAAAELGDVVVR